MKNLYSIDRRIKGKFDRNTFFSMRFKSLNSFLNRKVEHV